MIRRRLPGIFCTLFGAALAFVLLSGTPTDGLTAAVHERLSVSGVQHDVTAVLLNFRAYDTLLEMAVMLLVVVGVLGLQKVRLAPVDVSDRPLLRPLLHILLPVSVVIAGHLLWIGAFTSGGAFQAGAILGGSLVLGLVAGLGHGFWLRRTAMRIVLVVGLTVFLMAAAGCLVFTGHLLAYPTVLASTLILCIEAAAMLSIGVTLAALFVGGQPVAHPDAETSDA